MLLYMWLSHIISPNLQCVFQKMRGCKTMWSDPSPAVHSSGSAGWITSRTALSLAFPPHLFPSKSLCHKFLPKHQREHQLIKGQRWAPVNAAPEGRARGKTETGNVAQQTKTSANLGSGSASSFQSQTPLHLPRGRRNIPELPPSPGRRPRVTLCRLSQKV